MSSMTPIPPAGAKRLLRVALLPALLGLGLSGLAATAGQAGTEAPLQCGVTAKTERGTLVLEGVLVSEVRLEGSYRLRVASAGPAGRANIQQGGGFSALPNEAVMLGRVTVNAAASHDIALEILANGQSYVCAVPVEAAR